MDPRQNNYMPQHPWGTPQHVPYIRQSIEYYVPCSQYESYGSYIPYAQSIPPVPLPYNPYSYYPRGIPQALPMGIRTMSGVQPVPQVLTMPQFPKDPVMQGVLPEETAKLPPLPISLPPLASPTPLENDENKAKNEKLSHRKENGVYRCHKCERTYLSYPALYTHNKLKHPTNQVNPVAKVTNRGRPKKSVGLVL